MLKYGYFADSSIMVTILLQITSGGTLQQCCIISSDALDFMSENGNKQHWGSLPTEHNVYLRNGYFADSSIMVTIWLQITSRGTLQHVRRFLNDMDHHFLV